MFGSKHGIVGLDIGSRHIKAVQLKAMNGSYQLERFGIAPLLPELIVGGSILDSPRVVETIKGVIREAKINAKDVAVAVAGHASVIIKRVSLPEMSEEELSESIKFEAEQYIPFDIEDVNLDFQILGLREETGQMEVLIVAAKKNRINEYTSVVKEAGLNPAIVDVGAFATENMYEINYAIEGGKNIALVNVGASSIDINILKGDISVFTRDSSLGGNLHTEALQKEFSISYDDAERLKRGGTIGGISEDDVSSVLIAASEDIIIEISRSFNYFKETTSPEDIHEIVFCGGCALLKGFPNLLSERLGIRVKIVDPFKNIQIPASFDKGYLKDVGPIAAVAVGLALRRIGDR